LVIFAEGVFLLRSKNALSKACGFRRSPNSDLHKIYLGVFEGSEKEHSKTNPSVILRGFRVSAGDTKVVRYDKINAEEISKIAKSLGQTLF
jgi:hypothetical protein